MKKLLLVLGVLALLLPVAAAAQADPSYYVDYFSNNITAQEDGVISIVNVGQQGNQLTVPQGDISANIYVYTPHQEMIECCAENLTPNELDSADVFLQLTSNPLTGVIPNAGVIKIVLRENDSTAACNPAATFTGTENALLGSVWGTHPQRDLLVANGTATIRFPFLTETEKQPRPLSSYEAGFLPQACSFVRYLGSGFGVCSSTVSGDAGSGSPSVSSASANGKH